MVVRDFHVVCIAVTPSEANAPLVIDADAVLALSVPRQLFEPIAGRHTQILHAARVVEHAQLTQGRLLNAVRQLS